MSKTVAAMLVLLFMIAPCIALKPALSSAAIVEDSWESKTPMLQARYGLAVAVVNGKIYAIGGNSENGVVGTNEEYDPETDMWTLKTAMPTPRNYFAIAAYKNKIYCIGSGANEVYDPATDSWETKMPMPTERYGVQANVVNGKIYLIGGYDPNNSSSRFTLNEVYSPETDSWTTKTLMPNITYECVSAVVNKKIYFISGLARVQIYDTETDGWSLGAPPPSSEYHGAAVATTGVMAPKRVYVLGISGHQSFGEPEYFVRVYDPESDIWTFGTDIPTRRLDFGVAVVNDVLYVVGGYTLVYPDKYEAPYVPTLVRYAINEQYTPFGYGIVPPAVSVVSPENKTYTSGNVSLAFTVNKPAAWMGYSLDGQDNVTITGNTTLSGLTSGLHNVTVYARDEFENTGASETISFSVEVPFPTVLVAAASAVSVAIIGIGLLVYFKKAEVDAYEKKSIITNIHLGTVDLSIRWNTVKPKWSKNIIRSGGNL